MGVICRHQQVVELRLPGLNLTGSVSAATIAAFPQLEVLHLSDNTLSGAFPDLSTMPRLRTVDISNNRFSSVSASLLSATNNLCVTALFAHKNAIAAVPTQMFSHPALRVLNLGWNSMTGSLPTTWPSASILVQLTLSHNALSGALPTTLPNATLVILDLNGNKLTGTIPTGWGVLQNAEFIDLSHNLLSGAVPLELSQIRSGRKLVFSAEDNYFTGVLPRLPFARYDLRMNTFACPLPTEATFSLLQQNIAVLDQDCDWSQ
jgi:Leucine-rich repeat (LRR) protein